MHLAPYILFNGNCAEAFKFYERALGAKIQMMMTYGQSPEAAKVPAAMHDKVIHVSLSLGNFTLMGSDCPPDRYAKPQGFSLSVSPEQPAEAEQIFNALLEGGSVIMPLQSTFWSAEFGMLTDKYGIGWMVNCTQAAQVA